MDNISTSQPSGQRFDYHSMPTHIHVFALITPSHPWKFYLTSQSTTYWFKIYFPHEILVAQRLTSRLPIIRPVVRLLLHAFTYPDFGIIRPSAIYGNFIRHHTPLHIDLNFTPLMGSHGQRLRRTTPYDSWTAIAIPISCNLLQKVKYFACFSTFVQRK